MKPLTVIFAAVLAVSPLAGNAGSPVVVELFTSQGCSSCPPADAVLGELAERDDVLALSLHVDYWDYLGWKDAFALPKFTRRQRNYAHAFGNRSIYTPQIVVQGAEDVVGSRKRKIGTLIARHAAAGSGADLSARRSGADIAISLKPGGTPAGKCVVHLVEYAPEMKASITRGENAGLSLTYHNVVRRWIAVGDWDGRSAVTLHAESTSGLPVAVIVQAENSGPIMAAAKLK
ncbi:MAG: DUF1223 domain-containing protein [Paracoccaceae bacterium]